MGGEVALEDMVQLAKKYSKNLALMGRPITLSKICLPLPPSTCM